MEKVEVRLNNFLFNSGITGFLKILKTTDKEKFVQYEGNTLKIETKVFENFEEDYINTMLTIFEKDTRWYKIVKDKEILKKLDLSKEENQKELKEIYMFLNETIKSQSYKSGTEIAKKTDKENPYEYIERVKKEKINESMKENSLKIITYLEKHKEIYCMKDIIYSKIKLFFDNVAFLNSKNNKNDIKEEYKNFFVIPVQNYIGKKQNSEYNCIECGNEVGKSEAYSMSWLKDTGVDISRKKSGFWNFHEDTFLCPICKLIYSCVPLGFTIVGQNGIFINQNNSIKELMQDNETLEGDINNEKQFLEKIQYNYLMKLLDRTKYISDKKTADREIENIQVVKRKPIDKDTAKYEFNMISKEKLKAFEKANDDFKKIVDKKICIEKQWISIYDEVVSNFLENRNQYNLLNRLILENENNSSNINYLQNILNIQVKSKGGVNMEELVEKAVSAGRKLSTLYFSKKEDKNKLKTLILQLNNTLRANNAIKFMEIITRIYGSLGEQIHYTKVFETMIKDKNSFRNLGYAYIIGLEGYIKESEENKDEK